MSVQNRFPFKTSVAIGRFDGVHIAHQKVIAGAVDTKPAGGYLPMALTFDSDFRPSSGLILTKEQKQQEIKKLGIEEIVTLDLQEIRYMSPGEFVQEILANRLHAKNVFCGFNFKFGKGGSGDSSLLKTLCQDFKIDVTVIEKVTLDNKIVSSSLIREYVKRGEMKKAGALLGRNYSYTLPVNFGDQRGRTLGLPTINQHFPKELCIPKFGVYATKTFIEGKFYPSITNIGIRPTVPSKIPLSETYVFDCSEELYGKAVKIELFEYIRAEKKFSSLLDLKKEIEKNIITAKKIIKSLE